MNKSLGLKIDSNLNIRNQNNKIIVPKELKLKNIQKVIDKAITPKCQFMIVLFLVIYILDKKCYANISIGTG
jgi:hypothetical protein